MPKQPVWDQRRFEFSKRAPRTLVQGVSSAEPSGDGKHALLKMADGAFKVTELAKKLEPRPLNMSGVRIRVDPMREWKQIFDEAWRMERAYFYDPALHGIDWDAVYERYQALLPHVGRREDLNALLVEMIGELQVGHNRARGGDLHMSQAPRTGLLGADFESVDGYHRVRRVFTGEKWNPFLRAPLAAPGNTVKEGEYILAVDGKRLGPGDNIYDALQGTSKRLVTLRVGPRVDGRDARDVTVEPIEDASHLRLWAWVEANRRTVEEKTQGRVGYVYLPDTGKVGLAFFNRMFFAQVDKEGLIIDERGNGGGQAANYITDVLSRFYLSGWKDRVGSVFNTPGGGVYGPKVMLIDQDAGSGGDFLPYAFRELKLGPLIGKRTWGGLIGAYANPDLIDGGQLSVPFFRFFDRRQEWSIENEGVVPDIEVDLDPVAVNKGEDSQLDRAILEILKLLKTQPSKVPRVAPPYPTPASE